MLYVVSSAFHLLLCSMCLLCSTTSSVVTDKNNKTKHELSKVNCSTVPVSKFIFLSNSITGSIVVHLHTS